MVAQDFVNIETDDGLSVSYHYSEMGMPGPATMQEWDAAFFKNGFAIPGTPESGTWYSKETKEAFEQLRS